MKKKIIYSLAALTAFPGAVNAADVNVVLPSSQTLDNAKWSGNPTVSSGTVLVAEGASISQSIGELVPGNYAINIGSLVSTDSDLKITVGNVSKTVTKGSTKVTDLIFNLTTTQNVTVTIESVDGKSFTLTDITLKLRYDFTGAAAQFATEINKVAAKLKNVMDGHSTDDPNFTSTANSELALLEAIQKKIDEIDGAKDPANPKTDPNPYTDVYLKYKLYEPLSGNAIFTEISERDAAAVTAIQNYYVKLLNTEIDALYKDKTYSDEARAIAKSDYEAIKATFVASKFIGEYAADENTLKTLRASIKPDSDVKDSNKNALQVKLANAETQKANDAKYYQEVVDALKTAGADAAYSSVNKTAQGNYAGDRYANILAAAQKELSLAYQDIANAEKENESLHKAYKCTSETSTDLQKTITDAMATINGIITKYDTTKKQLDDAYDKYENSKTGVKSLLNAAVTAYNKLDDNGKAKLATAKSDAETAVANVLKAINAADVTTEQGDIATTMAKLDLTELVKTANEKITALTNGEKPYSSRLTDINNANSAINKLKNGVYNTTTKKYTTTGWNPTKEAVLALKYDTDAVSNYFTLTIAAIDNAIAELDKAAAKAEASGASDITKHDGSFYSGLDAQISVIRTDFDKLNTEATAAQSNYNTVVNGKDADNNGKIEGAEKGLVQLKADLDAANDKVKGLAIYTDATYNYKAKVEAVQKKIDAVYKNIADAKALAKVDKATSTNEYAHATAMQKVTIDSSIATDIKTINDSYAKDNTKYQEDLQTAMVNATVESYKKILKDLSDIDTESTKYGLSLPAIKASKDEIQKGLPYEDEKKAETAIKAADADGLNKIVTAINDVRTKLDELIEIAAQAENKVKANNDANTALGKAITSDKNSLENYYQAKIKSTTAGALGAEEANKTALADGDVQLVKDYKKEDAAITKAITDLKAAIDKDFKDEKLDGTQATHEQTIAALKTRIDNNKTLAENATKNLNKYNDLTTSISDAKAVLDAAVDKANAKDAANKEYKDTKLVSPYYDKIDNGTEANPVGATQWLAKYYHAGTAVANESNITDMLKQVTDFASTLEATAAANKTNYDAIVKAYNDAENTWDEVSAAIAKQDESSAREDFQQQLADKLVALKKVKDTKTTGYEDVYKAIGLADSETANDIKTKITNIVAEINAIKSQSLDPEKYSARIDADNTATLENIKKVVDAASEEYKATVDELTSYKNVNSTVLKNVLEDIKTAYDQLNSDIYQYGGEKTDAKGNSYDPKEYITFAEVVNEKYTKAADERAKTESPDVFDKAGNYAKDIQSDIDKLKKSRKAFQDAVDAAIKKATDTDFNTYQANIDAAIKVLTDLDPALYDAKDDAKNKTAATAKFKDATDLLAEAKDAAKTRDISKLDDKCAKLEKDLTKMLTADKYNAIKTALESDLDAFEAYVQAGEDYLASNAAALADFKAETKAATDSKTGVRKKFNDNNTAAKLNATVYNDIEKAIANFKEGGTNVYETQKANSAEMAKIQTEIDNAQKALDEAIAGISEYLGAGDLQNGDFRAKVPTKEDTKEGVQYRIDKTQDDWDAKRAKAALSDGDAKTAKTWSEAIIAEIKAAVKTDNNTSALYVAEKAAVAQAIANLEDEYNKYAASDLKNIEESEKLKADLEAEKVEFGKADTAAKLLAVQKKIEATTTAVLNANYGEGIANTAAKTELESQLAAVKDAIDLAKNDPDVDASKYADEIAKVQAQIEAIEAEIAAKEDNLAFNQDNLEAKIQDILNNATANVKTPADADQKKVNDARKASDTAYDKYIAAIDALTKSINDAKTALDKNESENAKASAFANKFNALANEIATLKATAQENKAAYKALKLTYTDADEKVIDLTGSDDQVKNLSELTTSVTEGIADLKETAAYRELKAQVADLQKQLKEITYTEDNYTNGDVKKIEGLKEDADKLINGVYDSKSKTYTTKGLAQIIEEQKNASTIADYLSKNGKGVEGGKYEEALDKINSAKKIIADKFVAEAGDANGDGKIDVADITAVVNAIGGAYDANADANSDGKVDVADITFILNKM